jgi:hypothetical protein
MADSRTDRKGHLVRCFLLEQRLAFVVTVCGTVGAILFWPALRETWLEVPSLGARSGAYGQATMARGKQAVAEGGLSIWSLAQPYDPSTAPLFGTTR